MLFLSKSRLITVNRLSFYLDQILIISSLPTTLVIVYKYSIEIDKVQLSNRKVSKFNFHLEHKCNAK